MINGCSRCGRSDKDMQIVLFKSKPLCEGCFAIECPPANVMCSFRCGRAVSDPTQLSKKQPLCNECAIKMNADVVNMRADMDYKVQMGAVEVKTDIFTTKTQSIVALKAQIEADETIENKAYKLAELLREQFEQKRAVIFDLNQQVANEGTEQRAIQVYLNNMANQLRASEREKLHLADINYKPQPLKTPTVKKIKTVGTSPKKATNKEISQAAKELGIQEFTLKAFVLRFGGDLTTAVTKIKASLADLKS